LGMVTNRFCEVVTQGIVMDLVSTGLPPSVAGIVGLNVLSQFDVEFDFVKEQITLFELGAVDKGLCSKEGLQKLAVAPISFSLPGIQVRFTFMQHPVVHCFCLCFRISI
jgi:hypothetical protein